MTVVVRPAQHSDIEAMVRLSTAKRREYATVQPLFWRAAEDADLRQAQFLAAQISKGDAIVLVAESSLNLAMLGFVVAALVPAPPVYSPGGLSCAIDDFCVESSSTWSSVGGALLASVAPIAARRGAVQFVIVCGRHDEPKRMFLRERGLAVASEWSVGAIPIP